MGLQDRYLYFFVACVVEVFCVKLLLSSHVLNRCHKHFEDTNRCWYSFVTFCDSEDLLSQTSVGSPLHIRTTSLILHGQKSSKRIDLFPLCLCL